jgi:cell division protein ZapA (FtsZ GTPase activity inhibitor)
VTAKKHTVRVSILNEEYAIRTETSPEHTKEVARYLDQAIREVMSTGMVVESNRAVVLAALQITSDLFEARTWLDAAKNSMDGLADFVRPLLPPSKRAV